MFSIENLGHVMGCAKPPSGEAATLGGFARTY